MSDTHHSRARDQLDQLGQLAVLARSLLASVSGVVCVFSAAAQHNGDSSGKDKLIVETILRMESFDFSKAPEKVTGAVRRYLSAHPATEEYFTLVDRHGITDESDTLLSIAAEDTDGQGGRALQCLLKLGSMDAITAAAVAPDTSEEQRANLMRALALSGQPDALNQLADVATGEVDLLIRIAAAKALGASRPGEKKLLALAVEKRLPADLAVTAAGILHDSADAAVREEAARHLTMPVSSDAAPLPPISELARRSGDAARGKEVYQLACFICHQIGADGIAFGPALTEIGDKLPKEALYASILEPSAAISFGYEGFELTLTNGAVLVGIVASETDTELAIRIPGGVTTSVKKAQIAERKRLNDSLMPAGLQSAMSEGDLIDLIEFLTSLKK